MPESPEWLMTLTAVVGIFGAIAHIPFSEAFPKSLAQKLISKVDSEVAKFIAKVLFGPVIVVDLVIYGYCAVTRNKAMLELLFIACLLWFVSSSWIELRREDSKKTKVDH